MLTTKDSEPAAPDPTEFDTTEPDVSDDEDITTPDPAPAASTDPEDFGIVPDEPAKGGPDITTVMKSAIVYLAQSQLDPSGLQDFKRLFPSLF